ncbi:DUF2550 domain-containing protein [Glutamicibacter soli]|uniref:DUF2550 domain-containing protein n=1 Tax=Glutamicibacter soli TaxID=453836 RepID=A0A365YA07_9MICC|nr:MULTISPECIES: DUF2550 domain-containing protein [Micrococcaceae]ALQ31167.1 hypothetical protein ATC04_11770 [Arthrobacter sp. YC-RL1]RBL99447.1 DUF2550 domain-containing protein [Glutamicibacter soli]RKS19359.1 uncharacterized protein DUF2550 [Arthrobacter sp. AG1021]
MIEITAPVLIALLVLAGIVMFFGAMAVRRIQLRRTLGTFDASILTPKGKWMMVIGRYGGGHVDLLRFFSVSPIPSFVVERRGLDVTGWRRADEQEALRIPPGFVIVELTRNGEPLLLAMDYRDYTGFSSWLEAGPIAGSWQI